MPSTKFGCEGSGDLQLLPQFWGQGFCPQPDLRLPKLDYRVVVTIRILTKIESVM